MVGKGLCLLHTCSWQWALREAETTPPAEPSLWYAVLTGIDWNGGEAVTVNGIYADVALNDPAFDGVVKAQFGANTSGVWMQGFGSTATWMWIYQSGQPNPEVVDVFGTGLPIPLTWVEYGPSQLNCFEATFNISDPTNSFIQYWGVNGGGNIYLEFNPGSAVTFDNPAGIIASLDVLITQTFGAAASLTIDDNGGGNFVIKILNTYIESIRLQIDGGSGGTLNEFFNQIDCP